MALPLGTVDAVVDFCSLVAESAEALQRAQAGHRRIEERLRSMKNEARRQITGTEARKDGLRTYLYGAAGRSSIDVRS